MVIAAGALCTSEAKHQMLTCGARGNGLNIFENNMRPVHARAQNLHFGVQNCRSHANKLLLKFLNKHVMICDDIVALKP